ncbi:uncharacterized protein N0V89_011190 [Didymosphaeria variabile]|uniref:Uncharacterized protein n=1 Tax=Didymosphaeria variabile TaxID=1932322 RepID=A0A9W8XCQ3_9PLEO|nr:uncharacterized protein N0V89_011190 [Didymosphaeria variabile]KAJ4347250.1 hypothetical protein N0V89_011190 [Didymosphaeria variabile]
MAAPSKLRDVLDKIRMAYPPHVREALDKTRTEQELLKEKKNLPLGGPPSPDHVDTIDQEIDRLPEDEAVAATKAFYPEFIPHIPEAKVYEEQYHHFSKKAKERSTKYNQIMQHVPVGDRPRIYTTTELTETFAQCSEELSQCCSMLKMFACRNEEQIRSRWRRMSRGQRMKILREIWPDIPAHHRPDIGSFRDRRSPLPSDCNSFSQLAPIWGLPYLNLEDLADSTNFLLLLNARAHNFPWKFAHADLAAAPVYRIRPELLDSVKNSHSVVIVPQQQLTTYLEVFAWKSEAEAAASLKTGLTVHPDHALQIFTLQDYVWRFLLHCCVKIIPGSLKDVVWDSSILPQALSEPSTQPQNMSTAIARDAPYRLPKQIDLMRLKSLIAATRDRTIDRIHQLREDPELFAEYVQDLRSHRPELLLDRAGKSHKLVGSGALHNSVLKNMIGDLYMDVSFYEDFHCRLCQWESLIVKHATDLVPGGQLPTPLMESITETRCSLEMTMLDLIDMFKAAFVSSLPMRPYFIRTSSNTSDMVIFVQDTEKKADSVIREALSVINMLFRKDTRDFFSLYTIMDELDRFLDSDRDARAMFTPLVVSILSRLSVISECLRSIDSYQPWAPSLEASYQEKKHIYFYRCAIKQGASWQSIRTTTFRGTNICSLGDPSDGKFEYPIHGRQNRQAAEKRAKAKTALNTFWEAADKRFRDVTGTTPYDLIQHIIETRVAPCLRSTKPCEKRAAPTSVIPNDFVDHDTTKEFTGNFSKLSVAPKTKPKTRGVAAPQDEVPANPDLAIIEVRHPTITVDKRAHKVFRSLFHSVDSPNQPSQVAWPDFVHAMVSAGFGAEKLPATSAWHFTPVLVDADRSIQFHEPHPSNKLPMTWAREYGRRLTRAYGWDGETFALKD